MNGIKRGEIHYIKDLKTNVGNEINAGRPAIVVSNNAQNDSSTVIQIVYMTTAAKKDLPTHVKLGPKNPPKVVGSTVLVENVYSISKERLDPYSYSGRVGEEDMEKIDRALLIGLDLERYVAEETKAEPEKCEKATVESEEVTALKVAADFYKKQYEALLDRVIKKAGV